jgi:hypothetical protein
VKARSPSRIELEVTRPFFLLIRPDAPPKISLDGKDFDNRPPGYFRAGLGVEKATGAHGAVTIGFLPNARPR